MENNVALVIGGSGDIGIETAKVLFGKGMDVCISYHSSEDETKNKLDIMGLKDLKLYKFDMNNEELINNSMASILNEHKKIDVVVYCVSMPIINKKIQELTWKDFQDHIDVQVKGLFTIIKTLSPLINGNHRIKFIVVLTEYVIGKPPIMLSHYITAKYGLMGFVKCMAAELAKNNCTFNMVSPGMVNTSLLSNLPKKLIEMVAYNNPMKRIAEPVDVAKVILFLASEDSDYLNGANILINGGNVFI